MKHVALLIMGFGKGGKTLAAFAASEGQSVVLLEKSEAMYGGTCINIACIPSKTLIQDAKQGNDFKAAMQRKVDVVEALNDKNYHNLADLDNDLFKFEQRHNENVIIFSWIMLKSSYK